MAGTDVSNHNAGLAARCDFEQIIPSNISPFDSSLSRVF